MTVTGWMRSLLQDILSEVSPKIINLQRELHLLITWDRSSDYFSIIESLRTCIMASQRWLPNFQTWQNFARESEVTSVLYSIPGNMGVYEQTRVLLLHLPKTFCSKK